MEKTNRETHDFMNVDSFSQLPFTRPSPPKENTIKLFGQEFGAGAGIGIESPIFISEESDSTHTAAVPPEASIDSSESNRKFECHYCCRNFPTSQALGGHQNAHKRERQHAKRAHLQSAMFHGSFTAAQMYGLMNYPRQIPPYYHSHPPSWCTTTTNNVYGTTSFINRSRFSGGNTSFSSGQALAINGSPLATWKSPSAGNLTFNDGLRASMIGTEPNSQIRYSYESKPSVQDQVSLDLHL